MSAAAVYAGACSLDHVGLSLLSKDMVVESTKVHGREWCTTLTYLKLELAISQFRRLSQHLKIVVVDFYR